MHFLELRQDIIEKINVIIADDIHRSYYFYSNDVKIEKFLRKLFAVKEKSGQYCGITQNKPENILVSIRVSDIHRPFLFGINSTEEELFYYKMKYC